MLLFWRIGYEDGAERATGCVGKNAKKIELNMWQRRRRKDGEETDRPAYWYDVKCDYQTSLKQEVESHHEGTNAQRKKRNS